MHKVTKEVQKQLQQLASMLPLPKEVGTKKVKGAELLSDPSYAGRLSGDIKSDKTYRITVNAVNHYKRLKRVFEEGGVAAVNKYMEPFRNKDQKSD